jgi:hypothetical protein
MESESLGKILTTKLLKTAEKICHNNNGFYSLVLPLKFMPNYLQKNCPNKGSSTGIREQFADLGFGGKSDQNLGVDQR